MAYISTSPQSLFHSQVGFGNEGVMGVWNWISADWLSVALGMADEFTAKEASPWLLVAPSNKFVALME